ncbi:cd7 antigen-like [Sardina pilchardus]|uniref:cd7 antigen-like n=1 Tax=Sardina pilchardus TaxID=27697 RepID=UPI002E13F37F
MDMMEWCLVVWLIVLPPALVNGEVVYLSQKRNGSIEFACSTTSRDPFAFYLRREWLEPIKEVLFIHEGQNPTFGPGETGRSRIRVFEDLPAGQVNVSISHLQGSDTDRYTCEFIFSGVPHDRMEPGRDTFLLYVADHGSDEPPCSCSSYTVILYTIAGAVGLLLLVIIGLTVAYCGKASNGSKPQPAVPIYEEMAGLQSGNNKAFYNPGEFGESEYVKPVRSENPYSIP